MHTKTSLFYLRKKALLLFIFAFSCLFTTPLYNMTTTIRRAISQFPTQTQRVPTIWRPIGRSIQTQPTAIQTQPTVTWRTKLANATSDTGSRLRGALSRYWYGESQILRNEIRSSNLYDDPLLWHKINNFLKNNTIETSEYVFKTLMQRNISESWLSSLQTMIEENKEFAHKMLLIVEIFFQSDEKNIQNVGYILPLIPNDIDPLKLEQLKHHFWNFISIYGTAYLIKDITYRDNLISLLPHNTQYFIDAIVRFCSILDTEITLPMIRENAYIEITAAIKQKKLSNAELNELSSKLRIKYSRNKIIPTYLRICSDSLQAPSCHHLLKYTSLLDKVLPLSIILSDNFLTMLQNALKKEKEMMDNYEVFYHGRRWEYGFLSNIFGILYSHKSGTKLKDFIFTHLDDPVIGNVSEKFFESEQKKHEYLVQYGNPYSHLTHSTEKTIPAIEAPLNRQRLLFLNKFLFGNLSQLSSNSIDYIIGNYNQGNINFSVEEIFNMFGYENVHKKYERELLMLQLEYENLSQYGELLQILVPKNIVDKCVYYTTSGGPKLEYTLPDGTKTTDIKEILKNENENPHDVGEYALINTHNLGLNPKSGIKMYSYNTVDREKWTAFQKKLDNFVPKLENALKQADAQKQQKQAARE